MAVSATGTMQETLSLGAMMQEFSNDVEEFTSCRRALDVNPVNAEDEHEDEHEYEHMRMQEQCWVYNEFW
jgi:hypothetical protein